MNRVVQKYPIGGLRPSGRFDIAMPAGAELLGVGVEANVPVVWALVDPDQPNENRRFLGVHTGTEIPNFAGQAPFLGTAVAPGGAIWHVWDGGGSPAD